MSAAGEKPQWVCMEVKRSDAGGTLYNAVNIKTGIECDSVPSYDFEAIKRRVARLNAAPLLSAIANDANVAPAFRAALRSKS